MGAWIMLMLAKRIPQKIAGMVGLAPAPDFPKLLIWDKLDMDNKRKLIKNKSITIKNEDGSENNFSYKLIKDSLNNLTFSCLFGIFVEFSQLLIPSRTAELLDLLANLFGASLGLILVNYLIKKKYIK